MEKYDSSIETNKHIIKVREYLDVIYKKIEERKDIKVNDINTKIEELTLIDLISMLYVGNAIPSYDDLFKSINKNSTNYLLISGFTKEEIMQIYLDELIDRGINHDKSKLETPEKEEFDIWTPKLRYSTYGSDEYKFFLKELKKALSHHYRYNRHHPEHFGNGIYGMTIMDLIEMLCDWKAASERHDDGDIFKSIEINQKRFGYSDSMRKVLVNTIKKNF